MTNDGILQTLQEDEEDFRGIWEQCSPHTMTTVERGLSLYRAVNYILDRKVPGALVECGVWKGGSIMLAMLTLSSRNELNRDIYLFDTFDGMTKPSRFDVDIDGNHAQELLDSQKKDSSLVWASCSVETVRTNVASTGYPMERVHFVQGDVQKTLSETETGPLALLRLDTDFHDSTLAELQALYPRLSQHGILIIDDYGHWQGCRRAVNEYFSGRAAAGQAKPTRPFLHAVDYTCRVAVRSEPNVLDVGRYDRIPSLPARPQLLTHFPALSVGDPTRVDWPYLRKEVPHIWRTDLRSKKGGIGVLSVEEAILLHNLALAFSGRRALEIGCHFGWSTAHLLAADLNLDIVDPALSDSPQLEAVQDSLSEIQTSGAFRLWAGYSPSILAAVRATTKQPWSFVFIDGNHDGDGPLSDAQAVAPFCAETAAVVFHDLTAPAVAAGLAYFMSIGWSTRVFNTMQIMGVAWRGGYQPVEYTEDEAVPDWRLEHLRQFEAR